MTLAELVLAVKDAGGDDNTEVVLYFKSEMFEPEVFVSADDGRCYLMESDAEYKGR